MSINIQAYIDISLMRDYFTDLILICENGYRIKTHKLILISGSQYFKSLLTGPMRMDSSEIYLPDVDGQVMSILVNNLYINPDNSRTIDIGDDFDAALKLFIYANKYMFTVYDNLPEVDYMIFKLGNAYPSISIIQLQDVYTFYRQTYYEDMQDENEIFATWIIDLIMHNEYPDISTWETKDIQEIISRIEYLISENYNEFDEMFTTIEHGQNIYKYVLDYAEYMSNKYKIYPAYKI